MLVVIGYPLVYTVWLSFHATPPRTGEWVFNGDRRITRTSSDPRFWKTTINTFYWTVGSTLFAFILGFGAALALHNPFPGRGVVRASTSDSLGRFRRCRRVRLAMDAAIATSGWSAARSWPGGSSIARWYCSIQKARVMPTLIAVNVWKEFPFVMVMLTAGLQTVPEGCCAPPASTGRAAWNQFWHVTIPHLKGVILITTLLLFVGNLNSFTLVWLMTGGGPANASQLWITEIYNTAFR